MASRAKRGSAATAGAGANEPEAESALDVAALLERDK